MYLLFEEAAMKIDMFSDFKEYHGNHKNFKRFCDFGGRCVFGINIQSSFTV